MVTDKTTLAELFELAKKSASNVLQGESFMVRDLFTGLEWNRIPRGLRTKLGSLFLSHVESASPAEFVPNGKTLQNQQIYKKL